MAYYIQVFIGDHPSIWSLEGKIPNLRKYKLTENLVIAPFDEDNFDALHQKMGKGTRIEACLEVSGRDPETGEDIHNPLDASWLRLTDKVCHAVHQSSHGGTLAYLETVFSGGPGSQGAFLCDHMEPLYGPVWSDWMSTMLWLEPINMALRHFGFERDVTQDRTTERDEFTLAGLGQVRFNSAIPERFERL